MATTERDRALIAALDGATDARNTALESIRLAKVLRSAWSAAEGRVTVWMTFAGGLAAGLLVTVPKAGVFCMFGFGVLAFLTTWYQGRDRKAIERAIEGGHDHD